MDALCPMGGIVMFFLNALYEGFRFRTVFRPGRITDESGALHLRCRRGVPFDRVVSIFHLNQYIKLGGLCKSFFCVRPRSS